MGLENNPAAVAVGAVGKWESRVLSLGGISTFPPSTFPALGAVRCQRHVGPLLRLGA